MRGLLVVSFGSALWGAGCGDEEAADNSLFGDAGEPFYDATVTDTDGASVSDGGHGADTSAGAELLDEASGPVGADLGREERSQTSIPSHSTLPARGRCAPFEICDGRDNDCDGVVDEESVDSFLVYPDADGDGVAVESPSTSTEVCVVPEGMTPFRGDCDDTTSEIGPLTVDGTSLDANCDGSLGANDLDGDGWDASVDCNDGLAAVNPGAEERCDGYDNDCDGQIDEDGSVGAEPFFVDLDRDAAGANVRIDACRWRPGLSRNNADCDDTDPAVVPHWFGGHRGESTGDCIVIDDAGHSSGEQPPAHAPAMMPVTSGTWFGPTVHGFFEVVYAELHSRAEAAGPQGSGFARSLRRHARHAARSVLVAKSSTAFPAVGELEGVFDVTLDGSASYSLEFQLPPSRAGHGPVLGLEYSSGRGNGPVGLGWALTGFSQIARCDVGVQDSFISTLGPAHVLEGAMEQQFCLDGSPLAPLDPDDPASAVMIVANRPSIRVEWTGPTSAPKQFIVTDSLGTVSLYGGEYSPFESKVVDSDDHAMVWGIVESIDVYGNSIAYEYRPPDPGVDRTVLLPSRVSWNGNSDAQLASSNVVEFDWGDLTGGMAARPDPSVVWGHGNVWSLEYLLSNVVVKRDGLELGRYEFTYDTSPRNGMARLSGLTACTPSDGCVMPTLLEYTETSTASPIPAWTPMSPSLPPFGTRIAAAAAEAQHELRPLVMDADGDGRDEVLVVHGMRASPSAPTEVYLTAMGVGTDGTEFSYEELLSDATGAPISEATPLSWAQARDLDGDGRDEVIIGFEHPDPTTFGAVWIASVDEAGAGTTSLWHASPGAADSVGWMDVDGDGYVGQLRWTPSGGGTGPSLALTVDAIVSSLPAPFTTPGIEFTGPDGYVLANTFPHVPDMPYVVDLDGNGRPEVVMSVETTMATGAGSMRVFGVDGWSLSERPGLADFELPVLEPLAILDVEFTPDGWEVVDTGDRLVMEQGEVTSREAEFAQSLPLGQGSVRFVDVNGDGLVDMLFTLAPSPDERPEVFTGRADTVQWEYAVDRWYILMNTGRGLGDGAGPPVVPSPTTPVTGWASPAAGDDPFGINFAASHVGDFDGDGTLEFLLRYHPEWTGVSLPIYDDPYQDTVNPSPIVDEIIVVELDRSDATGSAWQVHRAPWVSDSVVQRYADVELVGDFDGDGTVDLWSRADASEPGYDDVYQYQFAVSANPEGHDRLSRVTHGLGSSIEVTYERPSSDTGGAVYTTTDRCSELRGRAFGVPCSVPLTHLVRRVERSAPGGAVRGTTYRYVDYAWDRVTGAGLGFRRIDVCDGDYGSVTDFSPFSCESVSHRWRHREWIPEVRSLVGRGAMERIVDATWSPDTGMIRVHATGSEHDVRVPYRPANYLNDLRAGVVVPESTIPFVAAPAREWSGAWETTWFDVTLWEPGIELRDESGGQLSWRERITSMDADGRPTLMDETIYSPGTSGLTPIRHAAQTIHYLADETSGSAAEWRVGRPDATMDYVNGTLERQQSLAYDGTGSRIVGATVKTADGRGGWHVATLTRVIDDVGNVVAESQVAPGHAARQNTLEWDATSRVDLVATTATVDATSALRIDRALHPWTGAPVWEKHPDGTVSETTTDGFGRAETIRRPGVPDVSITRVHGSPWAGTPDGMQIRMDSFGAGSTVEVVDSHGVTTWSGRQVSVLGSTSGERWSFSHTLRDWLGRPTLVRTGYAHDGPIEYPPSVHPDTWESASCHQWDALGRQTAEWLPGYYLGLGFASFGSPDGSLKSCPIASTTSGQRTWKWLGTSRELTDERGYWSMSTWDAAGAVQQVLRPDGSVASASWDMAGRLTATSVAGEPGSSAVYDGAGNPVSLWDASTGAVERYYDPMGRVVQEHDAAGFIIEWLYDGLDRTISEVARDSGGTVLETTTWTWDLPGDQGRLGSIERTVDGTRVDYSYDSWGRSASETWSDHGRSFRFEYEYDTVGRLATTRYPDRSGGVGFATKRFYDAVGALESIVRTDTGALLWRAENRDIYNRLTSEVFGNDVRSDSWFDPGTLRLGGQNLVDATWSTLQSCYYAYDSSGNVSYRSVWHPGSGSSGSLDEAFEYDGMNRLVRHEIFGLGMVDVMSYDALGVMIDSTSRGPATVGDGLTAPRTAMTDVNGTSLAYDTRGNLVARGGDSIQRGWNSRIDSITRSGGLHHAFGYAADDSLLVRDDGTTVTWSPGGHGMYELEENSLGQSETWYVPGENGTVAIINLDAELIERVRYLHTDPHGSPTAATDEFGGVTEYLSYQPFGERRPWDGSSSGPPATDIREGFTSHLQLDGLGLVLAPARAYDPHLRMWLSPDPVETSLFATDTGFQ